MSDRMPTGQALEQLREVIAILRELGNAGPRDQSFKQWRQVTLTLLQRIWPDQANAARFRRIPFSPPSARADAKTVRECYERGVCEAIGYLESLMQELENGTSRLGRKLQRPVEAPLATAPEPEQVRGPEADSLRPEPEVAPAEPRSAPAAGPVVAPAREPSPGPRPAKKPASAAPWQPSSDVAPAAPAQAAPPPTAREKSAPSKQERRAKPRLKDMLGFGDEAPALSPPPALPSAREASAPSAHAAHAAPTPPMTPPMTPTQDDTLESDAFDALEYFEPSATPIEAEPAADEPDVFQPPPPDAPADEDPEWTAPIIPFPGHKVVVGRPTESRPPESFEDDSDEAAFDFDFDLAEEGEPVDEAPPATLREMLDRGVHPRGPAPPRAAREVLAMASAVDQLGVPPQRRAIVRAALIDLGRQMETPPVHWVAIRQAMAFMLDYPQIARRVIPMLLPYLEEAA